MNITKIAKNIPINKKDSILSYKIQICFTDIQNDKRIKQNLLFFLIQQPFHETTNYLLNPPCFAGKCVHLQL